jgi:hypothetical protein
VRRGQGAVWVSVFLTLSDGSNLSFVGHMGVPLLRPRPRQATHRVKKRRQWSIRLRHSPLSSKIHLNIAVSYDEGTQRDSRQRVEEHQTKGMSDGVIPETHRGANKDLATYSLLAGCSSWTLCSSDALAPCSAFAYRRVFRNLPVPISGHAELLF